MTKKSILILIGAIITTFAACGIWYVNLTDDKTKNNDVNEQQVEEPDNTVQPTEENTNEDETPSLSELNDLPITGLSQSEPIDIEYVLEGQFPIDDEREILVYATTDTKIKAYELDFEFDPSIINVVDIKSSASSSDDPLCVGPTINNENGTASIACDIPNRETENNKLFLISLVVKGLKTGETKLQLITDANLAAYSHYVNLDNINSAINSSSLKVEFK